ncbi:HEAT repeat domain-containing protein, partial [bacterium]
MPAASLDQDIQEVLNVKVGLPIDAIERLAADGAPARGPLGDAIKEGERPGIDRLPAVLTLGRMPFDLAVEPLLEVLGGDLDPLLRSAAAWSLARHGAAAVAPFTRLLERGQGTGRFWAAIGLGQTGLPEVLGTLRTLLEVPELVLPAAYALSKARDMEAIPLIHRAYLDVPNGSYLNFLYELMLDGCRGPIDGSPASPWYVHWRRRPELMWLPRRGCSEVNIFSNWLEPEALPGGMRWRKKGLKRYLKGRIRLEPWDEVFRCERCGFMRIPLLGRWECPETAFR